MSDVQISIDLSGVNPFDPTSFEDPPAGPHEIEITAAEQMETKKKAFKFTVKLASGMTTDLYVGSDFEKEGNKKSLKALVVGMLQAAGKPAEAANGKLALPLSTFVGKKAYIYVKTFDGETQMVETSSGPREMPKRADKSFITKDLFEKLSKAAPAASASVSNGAGAPAAAPAAGGATSLGSLFGT